MTRLVWGLIILPLAVGGCSTGRVQLMYFNPAHRPLAPVSASTITLLKGDDSRALDIDVEIKSPSDSALLIVLQDGVTLDSLISVLGPVGVADVRRSQRDAPPNLALPVVDVSAEGKWIPLKRQIPLVIVESEGRRCSFPGEYPTRTRLQPVGLPEKHTITSRYIVIPPSTSLTLRMRQIVYPVPESRNSRYRVRVNWISFPAERAPGSQSGCDVKAPRTAVADDLEAYGRRVQLNWLGATTLGVVLLVAGMAITGS